MLKYIILIIIIIILYIVFWTPYPFVWLLRSKKEVEREKGPNNIEEIKEEIHILPNLPYPSKYPQATYDLYLPKNQPIKHMIVWVHGGSFISGDSRGMRNFAPMLASQGYGVCAMNYAYAPRCHFPSQVKQVDEMLCHIQNDLKKDNIMIEDFILGGDSAGANIAATYASMYQNETLALKANVNLLNSLPIKGLLLFCGPYDLSEDFQKEEFKQFRLFMKYIGWSYLGHKNWWKRDERFYSSPLHNIHKHFPPAYICDGKKFSFMWQGQKLVQALKQQEIYVESRFYEHMSHEFQFDYQKNEQEALQVYEDTLHFLKHILEKESTC